MNTNHQAVSLLNRSGSGIRTYTACSCGWEPKTMPQRGSTMTNAYFAHLRTLGLPRPEFVDSLYGEGPAKGRTFDEWYAIAPGCDPFGVRDCDDSACSHGKLEV